MKTTRIMVLAGLLASTAASVASAQNLVVEGRYSTSQVISRAERARYANYYHQLRAADVQAYQYHVAYDTAYRQTGDARYLPTLRRIQADRANLQRRMQGVLNFLNGQTHVRMVAGHGAYYDRLPQLRWNESVPQFLNRNRHLLGRSIVVNARHLASGSGTSKVRSPRGGWPRVQIVYPPTGGGSRPTPISGGGIFGF